MVTTGLLVMNWPEAISDSVFVIGVAAVIIVWLFLKYRRVDK